MNWEAIVASVLGSWPLNPMGKAPEHKTITARKTITANNENKEERGNKIKRLAQSHTYGREQSWDPRCQTQRPVSELLQTQLPVSSLVNFKVTSSGNPISDVI